MKKSIMIFTAYLMSLTLTGCGFGIADRIADRFKNEKETITDAVKDTFKKPVQITPKERLDDWVATKQLTDLKPEELSVATLNATPVPVSFTKENRKEEWDSYLGGADVDYETAMAGTDAPKAVTGILDAYNDWVDKNTETELKEARERWELYQASDPDSFIALTPHIGMGLFRSDTSILSYMSVIHRYNRDYEPDDTFIRGYTFDAKSGRQLTLNDLVTDTKRLSQLLCNSLKIENGSYASSVSDRFLDEGFRARIQESMDGMRDDGHFAWAVGAAGFEFYLTDPFYESEYLNHFTEYAFVPFASCSDILYQEIGPVPYDYIMEIRQEHLSDLYGITGKLSHQDEDNWYTCYLVQKDEKPYIWLSADDEIQTYRIDGKEAVYVGSVSGRPADWRYDAFMKIIDPGHFQITTDATLIREMLRLSADACIGTDGQPQLSDLFRLDYYEEPMSVWKPFEAEVFSDENDTEPETRLIEEGTWFNIVRTDARSFIDVTISDTDEICRLYVTGSDADGWIVNGHPVDDVLNLQGWFEE